MNATNRKKPIASTKVGRFEIALFRCESRRLDNNDTERVTSYDRVRVRYSRYRHEERRWENSEIWCYPAELRDLAQVLDAWNGLPQVPAPKKEEGTPSSSVLSPRTGVQVVPSDPGQIRWAGPEDLTEEDRAEIGLEAAELDRLQYFAEHPERADPMMAFLFRGGRGL